MYLLYFDEGISFYIPWQICKHTGKYHQDNYSVGVITMIVMFCRVVVFQISCVCIFQSIAVWIRLFSGRNRLTDPNSKCDLCNLFFFCGIRLVFSYQPTRIRFWTESWITDVIFRIEPLVSLDDVICSRCFFTFLRFSPMNSENHTSMLITL